MKGKQFYFLLISLILVGVGSVFLYREREEQRVLEFEGYEITAIESRVDALYNEEKTDISQNISDEELEELEIIFEELDEKKLSRRSRDRIRDMQLDYLIAESMMETERDVEAIFIESSIVDKDITEETIDALEADVLTFENMGVYVDRNIELLAYARQQVVTVNRAREFVENLFDEENNVLESVTREDEEEALELIDPILNGEIKEELTFQLEQVNLVLTEREEELALEEALQQQLEEEERQAVEEIEEEMNEVEEPEYTAPPAPAAPPAQSWRPQRPPVQDNDTEEDAPEEDSGEPAAPSPEEPVEPDKPIEPEDPVDPETQSEGDLEDGES